MRIMFSKPSSVLPHELPVIHMVKPKCDNPFRKSHTALLHEHVWVNEFLLNEYDSRWNPENTQANSASCHDALVFPKDADLVHILNQSFPGSADWRWQTPSMQTPSISDSDQLIETAKSRLLHLNRHLKDAST